MRIRGSQARKLRRRDLHSIVVHNLEQSCVVVILPDIGSLCSSTKVRELPFFDLNPLRNMRTSLFEDVQAGMRNEMPLELVGHSGLVRVRGNVQRLVVPTCATRFSVSNDVSRSQEVRPTDERNGQNLHLWIEQSPSCSVDVERQEDATSRITQTSKRHVRYIAATSMYTIHTAQDSTRSASPSFHQ